MHQLQIGQPAEKAGEADDVGNGWLRRGGRPQSFGVTTGKGVSGFPG